MNKKTSKTFKVTPPFERQILQNFISIIMEHYALIHKSYAHENPMSGQHMRIQCPGITTKG
jgi:hypothetical protein